MNRFKKNLSLILTAALIIPLFAIVTTAQAVSRSNVCYGSYIGSGIPAAQIFRNSANAVFMLETFDNDEESIRTGSGFFISDTGLAVTNLHVIENAASATITLYDGEVYPVLGVHAVSEEFNLTIISIGSGDDDVDDDEIEWQYLTLADSDLIETGNSVYAIGSPLGYINTMTAGIISNTKREVDGQTLIQFTAPISFGSGGSPLLNAVGQVIGVSSSSFSYGQNLNLAVPINHIKALEPGELIPLGLLLGQQETDDEPADETDDEPADEKDDEPADETDDEPKDEPGDDE